MDELRNAWAIPTVDSNGKPVHLFVGEVDHEGKLELGVRVDGSPIALVPLPIVVARFLAALRQTSENTYRKNAEDER